MARPGNYLFQRRGSQNWHLKLQYPTEGLRLTALMVTGKKPPARIERSLGTPIRKEAEIIAAPMILSHQRIMLAHHLRNDPTYPPRFSLHFGREHQPGTTLRNDDGSMVVAAGEMLITIGADNSQTVLPNNPVMQPVIEWSRVKPFERRKYDLAEEAARKHIKDVDTEIVENWIEERKPAGTHANAARNMLALFKELHPRKSFATADRDDAREMVKRLEELGNVSATIKSKLSGLVAAVNLEMSRKKPRVKFNPFSGVATKKAEDTTKRMSLSEADVKAMEAKLDLFTDEERLLWTFCVNTGARPKEIYSLQEEFRETLEHHPITGKPSDIRYVWIDRSKNLASTRRVPIPAEVMPLLPKGGINGPMFKMQLWQLCGTINKKMQAAGITSPDPLTKNERKVFYSTRHRCKDRLTNAGCAENVVKAIIG